MAAMSDDPKVPNPGRAMPPMSIEVEDPRTREIYAAWYHRGNESVMFEVDKLYSDAMFRVPLPVMREVCRWFAEFDAGR